MDEERERVKYTATPPCNPGGVHPVRRMSVSSPHPLIQSPRCDGAWCPFGGNRCKSAEQDVLRPASSSQPSTTGPQDEAESGGNRIRASNGVRSCRSSSYWVRFAMLPRNSVPIGRGREVQVPEGDMGLKRIDKSGVGRLDDISWSRSRPRSRLRCLMRRHGFTNYSSQFRRVG